MSKRYLTVMVIPHNEDRVWELNVSRPFLWGLLGLLTISFGALVFYMVGYHMRLNRETELVVLKTENEELTYQQERLQRKLYSLRGEVNDLTETDRMMRAWVDFSEPGDDLRKMGVGGIPEGSPAWEGRVSYRTGEILNQTFTDLDQLVREAQFLKTSFDSIASVLSTNDKMRRHTPSIWPVPPDAGCYQSSGFGYRQDPFTGTKEFHRGLDIAGRKNTDILSTADGVVFAVGQHKYLGWYISINHEFGFRTTYGHLLKKPTLKEGQQVTRGQVIGKMGHSGRATAPHVHYMVSHRRGNSEFAVDPKHYIYDKRNMSSLF